MCGVRDLHPPPLPLAHAYVALTHQSLSRLLSHSALPGLPSVWLYMRHSSTTAEEGPTDTTLTRRPPPRPVVELKGVKGPVQTLPAGKAGSLCRNRGPASTMSERLKSRSLKVPS
ncbi:hypothetical protein Vretimale_15750 [Volvox reticuliferus]|uniref:Uncharacterized protein n=1 Tax=Volvox reticuliferus TaxID=1737510 RepID=A0A8J4GR66_9CHLO|nr:hypothetical protein Vretimale_15750 [Volvox reticuliferus]